MSQRTSSNPLGVQTRLGCGRCRGGWPSSSKLSEPRAILLGRVLRGPGHPRHSPAKPRCCRTRAPLEESQKPLQAFQVLLSHTGTRAMGESLLPPNILVRRAWMVPISVKLLDDAPPVAARRGCCQPSPPPPSASRRRERLCDTKFELSRNPRALPIDLSAEVDYYN